MSARPRLTSKMSGVRCLSSKGNDPRVVEAESKDVVESLKTNGVETEFLVFEDEGHDVLKFRNKVVCYTKITDFFKKHLNP